MTLFSVNVSLSNPPWVVLRVILPLRPLEYWKRRPACSASFSA